MLFWILFSFNIAYQKLETMQKVKQFSSTFFEACDWIKLNTDKDSLIMTIWAHRAAYNCDRTISRYGDLPDIEDIILSNNETLVKERLEAHGVTHLFVQKFSMNNDGYYLEKYPVSFVEFLESNPDTFKKVYENGPPVEQCYNTLCDGNIVYEIVY